MRAYYWNRYWLRFVCAGLILAAGCANQTSDLSGAGDLIGSAAGGLSETGDLIGSAAGNLIESTAGDFTNWPSRILEDSKQSFLRADNLTVLLLAGGASIAMDSSDADRNLAKHFERHRVFHGFADEGLNVIGHPWTQLGASVLWYTISKKDQNELNKERAKAMIAALSVTGVATMSLKAIRHNDAPNGKSWAWPSGHTASSFTVASMLDEFYGPRIGVPAYAIASVIGFRMLDSGDHWSGDVLFGATLGWVVGRTFAAKHKELEIAGFKVLPYTASNSSPVIGVNLVKQF